MQIITTTITADGNQIFLDTRGSVTFCEVGESTVQRASQVEPDSLPLRLAFRAIRACVRDTSKVAQWTRTWSCWWRIDTRPVGGPVLIGRYRDRNRAIEAEICFLNKFFLEGQHG